MLIRKFVESDFDSIYDIEKDCFDESSSLKEFAEMVYKNNVYVAEENGIIGFILFKRCKGYYFIINLCILSSCQRKGIGTKLLNKLKRGKVKTLVSDRYLYVHNFLRKNGFKAIEVSRDCFTINTIKEDCYVFEFRG